jgi:hypothetical protein
MTAPPLPLPFVTALRSRPGVERVGSDTGPRLTVRVTLAQLWNTIAFSVPATALVSDLRSEALAAFGMGNAPPEDYVVKLRGFEVLGAETTVAQSGARDGSTFLLSYRRRRPVR